jgi:hypothetical protein
LGDHILGHLVFTSGQLVFDTF